MPIYEYLCPKCELKFEVLRAMSRAGEDASCPGCGSSAGRVLSRFCRNSEGSPDSGGGNACSSCSTTSCSSCSASG